MKPWKLATLAMVMFCAPLLLVFTSPAQPDDFTDRLIDFNRKYYSFTVLYLGCNDHPRTDSSGVPQDCLSGGEFDVKRFNAAKHSAEKLFDLQPRP